MLNMTDIPTAFGEILGLEYEVAGVMITMVVVLISVLALALLTDGFNILPIATVSILEITFFTYLEWFPIWITIIIAGLTAYLWTKTIVNTINGSNGG